jgi:type IX secretion system PorP/SprF family membrane protein
MKRNISLIAFICLGLTAFAQQDPQYSQYMFNQIGINPAYAGTRNALSANLFYRSQWTGLQGAPNTEVFNLHTPALGGKLGLGLQFVGDQLGPVKTTSFLSTYAYKIQLGKGHLSFGLTAGLIDRVINYNKIDYKDQTDIYSGLGTGSKILPTFDFGLYYYTKTFYLGISETHLNQPAYGIVKDNANGEIDAILKIHTFFTCGKAWELNDNLVFRPSVMVKYLAGAPVSIDINASFLIKQKVWLGAAVRSGGAIVGIVEYNVTSQLKIGYAYDMTLSALAALGQSSNELFLGYNFNIFKTQTLSTRYF